MTATEVNRPVRPPSAGHCWFWLAYHSHLLAERDLPERYQPAWLRLGNWFSDRGRAARSRSNRRP